MQFQIQLYSWKLTVKMKIYLRKLVKSNRQKAVSNKLFTLLKIIIMKAISKMNKT